jgi:hypothetical protein
MSEFLRAAIRDGNMIAQARRRDRAEARAAAAIVCTDKPLSAGDESTLRSWIADELAK